LELLTADNAEQAVVLAVELVLQILQTAGEVLALLDKDLMAVTTAAASTIKAIQQVAAAQAAQVETYIVPPRDVELAAPE
jgi:hypothetical protein